jgi:hypothetical protein
MECRSLLRYFGGKDLETSRQQIESKRLPVTSESEAFASSRPVWGWEEGVRGVIFKDLALLIR